MTHRNRELLDIAHEAPCFLQLAKIGCGLFPSVPCHSDMLRHGRGEKFKSHDCFAVPGCPACHTMFKRSVLGAEGYHQAWVEAMERYLLYLWVSEKIQVTGHPKAGKEPSMEAPKCRLCEKHHWAREGCNFGTDTRREGRRVLKGSPGSTAGPASRSGKDPAKPTRTASTERPNPPTPPKAPGDMAHAEKARTGKPKTAPKKKAKKK